MQNHYLDSRRWTCIIDHLSAIPFHAFLYCIPGSKDDLLTMQQYGVAWRLPKILKMKPILIYWDDWDLKTQFPTLLRTSKLILCFATVLHTFSCGFYRLSEYEGFGSSKWVLPLDDDGFELTFARKYLYSTFWSLMILTTIGNTWGDPETDAEYIFTGITYLVGVFLIATLVGNICDIVSNMNENRLEFQKKIDSVKSYMNSHSITTELQSRIRRWAAFSWSRLNVIEDADEFLNFLPDRFKNELATQVHLESLQNITVFKKCTDGFLNTLVTKLRRQCFLQGEYIVRTGEIGADMYIIDSGEVGVFLPNEDKDEERGRMVAKLVRGDFFGEISLFSNITFGTDSKRMADVISSGYTEVLVITKNDFRQALTDYPDVRDEIEKEAWHRVTQSAKMSLPGSLQNQGTGYLMKILRYLSNINDQIINRFELKFLLNMVSKLKRVWMCPGQYITVERGKDMYYVDSGEIKEMVKDSEGKDVCIGTRGSGSFSLLHMDKQDAEFGCRMELHPCRKTKVLIIDHDHIKQAFNESPTTREVLYNDDVQSINIIEKMWNVLRILDEVNIQTSLFAIFEVGFFTYLLANLKYQLLKSDEIDLSENMLIVDRGNIEVSPRELNGDYGNTFTVKSGGCLGKIFLISRDTRRMGFKLLARVRSTKRDPVVKHSVQVEKQKMRKRNDIKLFVQTLLSGEDEQERHSIDDGAALLVLSRHILHKALLHFPKAKEGVDTYIEMGEKEFIGKFKQAFGDDEESRGMYDYNSRNDKAERREMEEFRDLLRELREMYTQMKKTKVELLDDKCTALESRVQTLEGIIDRTHTIGVYNQITDKVIDESTSKVTDESTAQVTDMSSAKVTDLSTAKVTDLSTAKVTELSTAHVTELSTAHVTGNSMYSANTEITRL